MTPCSFYFFISKARRLVNMAINKKRKFRRVQKVFQSSPLDLLHTHSNRFELVLLLVVIILPQFFSQKIVKLIKSHLSSVACANFFGDPKAIPRNWHQFGFLTFVRLSHAGRNVPRHNRRRYLKKRG